MRRIGTVLAVMALAPGGVAFAATTADTTLVSVTVDGTPASGMSGRPAISTDGRFVAFSSSAKNLVRGDGNGVSDIFVRDRQNGATTRVSVSTAGVEGDGASGNPVISGDGRYVVFESLATNLVPGDTNGVQDIFERDLVTGKTTRVSGDPWTQANGESADPAISQDGQTIVYDSLASNLASGDTNGVSDIFQWKRGDLFNYRINLDDYFREADGPSWAPTISANGDTVAFNSDADNLDLRADTNHSTDVFVRQPGDTRLVSRGSDGALGNGTSRGARLSADGRHIVFESYATNLVPGDTNNRSDLFTAKVEYWDTITRVNVDPTGAVVGGYTGGRTAISGDGRYVAFSSPQDFLVPGDSNGHWDVVVRDTVAGTTALASVATNGTQGDSDSLEPSITPDGRQLAFKTYATTFAPDTPQPSANTFVRDLG
ncbi:hypothetical protein [Kutzneria sp. 744]|uniref:hypothetical protein n=1 Tax=Kutzneria sp. (strain 744) TaxID=345341 RepID=UPI001E5BD2D6|nr:hypothetical protein [Kutzneria sp. 744]